MKNNVLSISFILPFLIYSQAGVAASKNKAATSVPQPTACMAVDFTKTGDEWWSNISLKVTNQCGKSVDLQNATITFGNAENLNTNFWGNFASVVYPDNNLQITSQPNGSSYTASLSLHFPEQDWANTKLANGQSITLEYGGTASGYDASSAKVYLNGQAVQVGNIDLTNNTPKPSGVSQDPWIDIKSNTTQQVVNRVQVPWGGVKKQVTGLAPDTYAIQPENVTDTQGANYQATATPNTVTVKADQTVSSTLSYVKVVQNGKVKVQVQTLPQALSGYANNPEVVLTRKDTGSTLTKTTPWNATTTVDQLANNAGYRFSSSMINYNSNQCTPSFAPIELLSNEATPQTTQLTYNCVQIKQNNISLDVSGLPETTSSVEVTFTPSDGSARVTKTLSLSDGKGNDNVKLTDGVVYNVSADPVSGYSASFSPQPLTSTQGASEKITYTSTAHDGKAFFVAYYPTWFAPYYNTFCDTGSQYYDYDAKSWKACVTGAVLPDSTITKSALLAGGVPDYITQVVIAFAKLNAMHNYTGLSKKDGDLQNLGLSLNVSSASFKESIRVLKQNNPGTKVILALGGASYNDSWNNVTEADTTQLSKLMVDLDLDGLDVDYELVGTDTRTINGYYDAIVTMRKAVDQVNNSTGKKAILTIAGWSVGADCTAATQGAAYPGCAGKVSYFGGNAGRERMVLQGKGASAMIDVISVMSYDADYQHFDPIVAYNEYKTLAKPGALVALGIQPSPDEGWGGARTLVQDRGINNDCVGNTILQDQYNNRTPGTFSVQRFAEVLKQNPGDGAMMWSLFAYRPVTTCGSVKLSTVTELAQGVSQYLGIGTDRTTQIDYDTAINYGRH